MCFWVIPSAGLFLKKRMKTLTGYKKHPNLNPNPNPDPNPNPNPNSRLKACLEQPSLTVILCVGETLQVYVCIYNPWVPLTVILLTVTLTLRSSLALPNPNRNMKLAY